MKTLFFIIIIFISLSGGSFAQSPPNTSCGTVLNFDGVNDHIAFCVPYFFDTTYTVEGWFKSSGSSQDLFTAVQQGSNDHYILFELNASGQIRFLHRSPAGDGGGTNVYSTNSFNDNNWHHAAIVKTSDSMFVYVDGSLEGNGRDTTHISDHIEIVFGKLSPTQNERYFEGLLDEFGIWEKPLTQVELATRMGSSLMGNEAHLLSYWNFDEGRGSSELLDHAMYGNHGLLINMDSVTAWTLDNGDTGGNFALFTDTCIKGGDSLMIAGQYRKLPDMYQTVFTASNGCDSIIYTNLCISTPTNGSCGTVLNFDGNNDFISLTETGFIGSTYTIESWFKTSSAKAQDIVVFEKANESLSQYALVELDAAGVVRFLHRSPAGGGGGTNVYSLKAYNDDQWHHVAAVKDEEYLYLYLDGQLTGIAFDQSHVEDDVQIYFAALTQGPPFDRNFQGDLDEVVLWNRALSQEEVKSRINSTLLNNENGLVGHYDFNEGMGSMPFILDLTSDPNNGTMFNMNTLTDWILDNGEMGGNVRTMEERTIASGDSTLISGVYIKLPGIYVDSLFTAQGCDSLVDVTLNLTPPNELNCGNAFSFLGTNSRLIVEDADVLTPTNITIEAWVRSWPHTWSDFTSWINKRNAYMFGGVEDSYEVRCDITTAGGTHNLTFDPGFENVRKWHHYAITFDGNTIRGYVDGEFKDSTNHPFPGALINNDDPLYFGYDPCCDRQHFGFLDEVRIWNTVRTEEQIKENMVAELIGSEPGLMAYYNFNAGAVSSQVFDQT